jgi:hypothetical protein
MSETVERCREWLARHADCNDVVCNGHNSRECENVDAIRPLLSLIDEQAKEIERLRDALRRIADPSVVCAHTFVPQIGCVHAIATAALKEKPPCTK